jgi:hypothetical protein
VTALAEQAGYDAEIKKILDDASIGHRTAARMINELGGEGTSEKSVRRYRRTRAATWPMKGGPDLKTEPSAPRTNGSGWTPGIDYDPAEGGEFRTVPKQVDRDAPEAEPAEDELLRQWDLDPAVWEVVSARKSLWQGGAGGTWLEARRVSFRKRSATTSAAELDIDGIMSKYIRPYTSSPPAESARIVMVAAGDLQLGKSEGGGTAATIDRFCRITEDISGQLEQHTADQMLLLPWMGDCIEGIVSQNSRLIASLDISITEQVRSYRRLMMHQIAKLAPLCERMIIPVVPGNHDETTREQVMPLSDSWAIEGAMAVADWMDGRPGYEHVSFVFPEEGEPDVTITVERNLQPYTMTFIHGHTPGVLPGKIIEWWKGQSHGRQQAGLSDMLVTAHFHHLRVEHTGGGRTWLQIPALDGGSSWFRHRKGEMAPTGIVSVEITPGTGQGWKDLTVHS